MRLWEGDTLVPAVCSSGDRDILNCRPEEGHGAGPSPGLVLAGRVVRAHHRGHPAAGEGGSADAGPEDGPVLWRE